MEKLKAFMRKKISLKEFSIFILLVTLAIIFKLNKFETYFGIVLDFSGIFLILILLTFKLEKALITTMLISLLYVVGFNGEYIQVIDILKIFMLGILCVKKWNLNIVIGEFVFWVIFTIPINYSILFMGGSTELRSYYNFTILFLIVNGVLNAFIAEIIFVYLMKRRRKKGRFLIRYKEIILHIVTLAILIPFVINIFTNLDNSYGSICDTAESSSDEIYHYILDELELWDERSLTNLQLSGVIEMGILEDIIKKYSRYKPYNIHITGRNNRVIIDIKNAEREIIKYEEYKEEAVTEKLSKLLPIKNGEKYFDTSWAEGYFLYEEKLANLGLNVMIEIPTTIYNEKITDEYVNQFKFLLFFILFIAIISTLFNRIIFNSLDKLSIETKNLPKKLAENLSIVWPVSNITEINLLTDNIDEMSYTLRENFIKLNSTQKRLYELAYYDILTNLPNRVFFKKHLEELIEGYDKNYKITVMFIDLNRFKIINDTWGHHIGDMLLVEVANRFKKIEEDNRKIFRLGGDEFVIVLKFKKNKEIDETGKAILDVFSETFKINDSFINTNCSIGASIYPDHSKDIDTIIKYADIAMYNSKENGGNYLQIFNNEIKEVVMKKIAIEEGINSALERNQFTLYYQPKFGAGNDKVKSLEALIRWENSSLGIVSPDEFIPIAEESDLILDIDRWVILNACMENKKLQNEGYEKIPISVNVSAKHFAHIELLDVVKFALNKSGLEAKYLKIEITEGVLIKNLDMVSEIIIKLKKLGVQVSIDDFGKGYSSINQLMSLPINEVKIDRDFIKDVDKVSKKKNVVKLIVELAHSLKLNVVAEGIEAEEEKVYLKSINCDELQGYFFSKPIKIEELKKMLSRGRQDD